MASIDGLQTGAVGRGGPDRPACIVHPPTEAEDRIAEAPNSEALVPGLREEQRCSMETSSEIREPNGSVRRAGSVTRENSEGFRRSEAKLTKRAVPSPSLCSRDMAAQRLHVTDPCP